MNRVVLSGRLTKDPVERYTTTAIHVEKYTLAVDSTTREGGTNYINCSAFGKNAEFAKKYLKKGIKVMVEGHWQTGHFKGTDGKEVYTNECIIDRCEFCETKNVNEEIKNREKKQQEPMQEAKTDDDGFLNIPDNVDDELPFI